MSRNMLKVTDLVFVPFNYDEKFPEINCCSCGARVMPMGGFMADIPLGEGYTEPLSLITCSRQCVDDLQGPKAGTATAFIHQEIGRMKRIFDQDNDDKPLK